MAFFKLQLIMVKKLSNLRKAKKPAKKISLRKRPIKGQVNQSKKINSKKPKYQIQTSSVERNSDLKEKNGINSELISQSFLEAQSYIRAFPQKH